MCKLVPEIQLVPFFVPYIPKRVAEIMRTRIGIGGPPPRYKSLNNATNKIVPPKTELARNIFLFESLSSFNLHKTKIKSPIPIW